MNNSLPNLLKGLWQHIDRKKRIKFFFLIVIIIIASIAEVISIGAVIPFLGAMTAPETIIDSPYLQPIILFLNISTTEELLFLFTSIFIIAAVFSGSMRLFLLWFQTRLGHSVGASIGIEIYNRTLFQPYSLHISRNSSEVITGITQKASVIVDLILIPIFSLCGSSFILISILSALMIIDPYIALFSFVGFGSIYFIIILITQTGLARDGELINKERNSIMKSLQEGLGGIRDVLLSASQILYVDKYKQSEIPMRRAYARINVLTMSPRFAIESLGMILIALMAYYLSIRSEGISSAIPILGAFALGAQRLLPVLQQAYGGWQTIRGGQAQFIEALELLNQPLPDYVLNNEWNTTPMKFKKCIEYKNMSFNYTFEGPKIIDNISLKINKGSKIGFIGSTGSGKSTLLDITMGLLSPTEGDFAIDDTSVTIDNQRSWQLNIAHVPQTIFLSDTTIKENIAFGVPLDEINMNLVIEAAKKAQISSSIESWKNKYDTHVGERGIKLSGGQRQRIGIARALYKKADVIILDEATSALDNKTEKAVMSELNKLDDSLTIFIVAHRLTTLENCDQIVELEDGKIKSINTYNEIIQ
jgi:ATP-binding cassette, subfamily B, bacterial PglK